MTTALDNENPWANDPTPVGRDGWPTPTMKPSANDDDDLRNVDDIYTIDPNRQNRPVKPRGSSAAPTHVGPGANPAAANLALPVAIVVVVCAAVGLMASQRGGGLVGWLAGLFAGVGSALVWNSVGVRRCAIASGLMVATAGAYWAYPPLSLLLGVCTIVVACVVHWGDEDDEH